MSINNKQAASTSDAAIQAGVVSSRSAIIRNPVLPGFNPDPCMIRVKDTYYIAVSSFEWLPGVRVYESNDLISWSHCTDILTDQVQLQGNPKNGSIWAPQLSYDNGLFYLAYTDVKSTRRPFKDAHNYIITAADIHGPWSKPVYVNSSGFDPSLFHDDDGRKWVLNALWDYRITEGNKSSGIVIQEYDVEQQRLIGEPIKLFDCTDLKKTEAPHLYKHNGYYYLITAEGGTGTGHAVTVARSRTLLGTYEVDPHYPMMTSSAHPDWPLQCAGHASLVETPDGQWYMAHLCTRPLEGQYAILGRETAIQQVYWDEEGWLRLSSGGVLAQLEVPAPINGMGRAVGRIESDNENGYEHEGEHQHKYNHEHEQSVDTHTHSEAHSDSVQSIQSRQAKPTHPPYTFHDSFTSGHLHSEWNTLRILAHEDWCSLVERPCYLRLYGGESLQSLFQHHLIAIRQRHHHFRVETALDYHPQQYLQMAGLVLYLNDENYLYACVSHEGNSKVLRLMRCAADQFYVYPDAVAIEEQGIIHLAVEVHDTTARFYYQITGSETSEAEQQAWKPLYGEENISFLSGGFTGNFVGIAAHDMYQFKGSYADFSHFSYEEQM